jgi:cell division septation protein DedD
MKITLNTQRMAVLGAGSLVLGTLLFFSGMVVGAHLDPAKLQQAARLPQASAGTGGIALPLEPVDEKKEITGGGEAKAEEMPVAPQDVKPEPLAGDAAPVADMKTPLADKPMAAEKPIAPDRPKAPTEATAVVLNKRGPESVEPVVTPVGALVDKEFVSASAKAEWNAERNSGYSVQVGAFLDRRNAEATVAKLRKKGYAPYITVVWDLSKRQWHTVRLGNFSSEDAAVKLADELRKKERMEAAVRGLGAL